MRGQAFCCSSSVIIPTRNRADVLDRCLASLARQTAEPEKFEVLVIDNGSTDHTPSVARKYASQLQLTYVIASQPGLHVGRHEGMRRAKSDILMFVDDDIEAEPSWVEAVSRTFDAPEVALVGGNNYPLFEEQPPPWLLRMWARPAYKGRALGSLSVLDFGDGVFEIDPYYVWGCNFSIRRDVLANARGFHPDGFPKELLRFRGDGETHVSHVVRSLGLRSVFNSQASVKHRVPRSRMSSSYFQERAYAQGVSDSFSEIRRRGGLNIPWGERARRRFSRLRSSLEARLRPVNAEVVEPVEREMCDVERAATLAYWNGYEFHRQEVSSDPRLLAWVLREDYLG